MSIFKFKLDGHHVFSNKSIIHIGVAVGCGWQQFVAYVNIGCYYIVGVPLGVLLGFVFKLGVKVMESQA
jgi:Na+-driven multidrug efflux pump